MYVSVGQVVAVDLQVAWQSLELSELALSKHSIWLLKVVAPVRLAQHFPLENWEHADGGTPLGPRQLAQLS